jgi:hypothetical protein
MKAIIIGVAPGKNGDPRKPLLGPGSGDRLARLSGLTREEYAAAFDRVNLYFIRPESFRPDEAVFRTAHLIPRLRGRRVIMLGGVVAAAFGLSDMLPFRWIQLGDFLAAWMPHPSGLNRWWNRTANRRRASRFLHAVCQKPAMKVTDRGRL